MLENLNLVARLIYIFRRLCAKYGRYSSLFCANYSGTHFKVNLTELIAPAILKGLEAGSSKLSAPSIVINLQVVHIRL